MTKYNVAAARRAMNEKPQLPAIWRGIGCLMIVVIPVVSYILAYYTVQLAVAQNWPMPYQLMGAPIMPSLLRASDALLPIVQFIESQQNLYAVLLLAVVYIVVLGGAVSLVYTYIYRYVGPPRYGPLDAPPSKTRVKRYKR